MQSPAFWCILGSKWAAAGRRGCRRHG